MASMVHCQLWMGSLEPYMTETFIITAFRKTGENPLNVKVMRNKFTGEPAGYCFVQFATDEEAIDAMHKLNGKPISGTNPLIRFRLNNASNTGRNILDREFSVWVGDLSTDVDDYNLYIVFSSKYNTIKTAKGDRSVNIQQIQNPGIWNASLHRVIVDNSGFSKGYGFVRFGSEEEMKDALVNMNGFIGLGTKALKICNAVPKSRLSGITAADDTISTTTPTFTTAATDYSQYYDSSAYWQNYTSWHTGYYDQGNAAQPPPQGMYQPVDVTTASQTDRYEEDQLELIEHSLPVDVDRLNRETMEQDSNLWDAVESSKWVMNEDSEIH